MRPAIIFQKPVMLHALGHVGIFRWFENCVWNILPPFRSSNIKTNERRSKNYCTMPGGASPLSQHGAGSSRFFFSILFLRAMRIVTCQTNFCLRFAVADCLNLWLPSLFANLVSLLSLLLALCLLFCLLACFPDYGRPKLSCDRSLKTFLTANEV